MQVSDPGIAQKPACKTACSVRDPAACARAGVYVEPEALKKAKMLPVLFSSLPTDLQFPQGSCLGPGFHVLRSQCPLPVPARGGERGCFAASWSGFTRFYAEEEQGNWVPGAAATRGSSSDSRLPLCHQCSSVVTAPAPIFFLPLKLVTTAAAPVAPLEL